MNPWTSCLRTILPVSAAFLLACAVKSQEAPRDKPPEAAAPSPSAEQAADSRNGTPIRTQVNLATIPVVVRDSNGRAIGDLQKGNFQLFDNGKLQEITHFVVEKSAIDGTPTGSAAEPANASRFVPATHFTAMLFDDMHLTNDTLPQLRTASLRRLSMNPDPSERIGIFTTSGVITVDFTDDRAALRDAVSRLKWNPLPGSGPRNCPDINHQQANLILNRNDQVAKGEAIDEAMHVCGIRDPKLAEKVVTSTAQQVLELGDAATQLSLKAVSEVIARLATVPGQRNLILLSPGFLISDPEHSEYRVVDLAVRNHVVISSLDSKGVLTDKDDPIDEDPLAELASGTGGGFYRNNNNLEEDMRRLSANPEYRYVLAFSPSELKYNGAFHNIRIKITDRDKLVATWRKGYFAPKDMPDGERTEKQDIGEAVFSTANTHDLPVEMRIQFIRNEDKPVAKLSVLALMDLQEVPALFVKPRNQTELRVVAVIFDHNGKYLGVMDKKIDFQWSSGEKGVRTAAKYDFILDSGDYFVRLVVRDSQTGKTFSDAGAVTIP